MKQTRTKTDQAKTPDRQAPPRDEQPDTRTKPGKLLQPRTPPSEKAIERENELLEREDEDLFFDSEDGGDY
jgi:hypothetical protein